MPLEIEHRGPRSATAASRECVTVGLLNNMPDAALEATEQQFGALLALAAGPRSVRLRFSSLPELTRGAAARARMDSVYWPLDELLSQRPDALIVTGTEPRTAALEDEPYWDRLTRLIGWAETHTASSIWSCLAAHAVAQALHGVRRRRLAVKCFGVFEQRMAAELPLLQGLSAPLLTPHSRWNELPPAQLESAGFDVLSASDQSGADLFVHAGRSLLVCFQGHPEYERLTLLKEYRRDVGRFLGGEHAHWPTVPQGYFSPQGLEVLAAFRARVGARREAALLAEFPMAELTAQIRADWRPAAVRIYRNWLSFVAAAKESTPRERLVRIKMRATMSMSEVGANPTTARTPRERLLSLVRQILGAAAGNRPLPIDARLSDLGISSIKMVGLMLAIEAEFNLALPQDQITPENFHSIASMEAMLERIAIP